MSSVSRTVIALIVVSAAIVIAGCNYTVPVTESHRIKVDEELVGLWNCVEKGQSEEGAEQMLILKYSDTEYMIQYPVDKDAIYFSAYPVRVGKLNLVQLKVIGGRDGGIPDPGDKLYCFASYAVVSNTLTVRMMNDEVVPGSISSSRTLARTIKAHEKDENLFNEPGVFVRD